MERNEKMPDIEKEVQEQTAEVEEEKATEKEIDTQTASAEDEKKETEENVAEESVTEETAASDADAEDEKAEGKKIFGKKEKKKDKTQEKIEELEDKVKRQLAEFENFRNRSEKEKTAMFETGAKSVIEKMLPIIDNFERGLMTVPEEEKESPFVDGMNKIYKQMVTELEAIGVKPIEAVGLEFDPNLHNAVMQVESEEFESGVVAQELQKGYTYHDIVVRHSMVAVVQ
jgi:molecular chaperone GrpE